MEARHTATPCTCRKDIEAKLTERFAKQALEASDHKVRLTGYAFILEGSGLVSKGCMPMEATATFPLKKGGAKAKTQKQSIVFSYCPFCGAKYPSSTGAA